MIVSRWKATIGYKFVEAHELDKPTAAKVPRKMIGRALTTDEAAALIERQS